MGDMTRRDAVRVVAAGAAGAAVGCSKSGKTVEVRAMSEEEMKKARDAMGQVKPLGFPWETRDPFLFCAYHKDPYPKGNEQLGPAESLAGRRLGMDFDISNGWRMYHGQVVPGFPQHPHRGFETVTIVDQGLVDHSDSLGATARFGKGDVQWLTAGKGIVHAEMFPLVRADEDNPLELFQIWLNLPAKDKMVDPYFTMLWGERVPRLELKDSAGRTTQMRVVAGTYGELTALPPPPNSWASSPTSDVGILTIKMEEGAEAELPAAKAGVDRTLYFHRGKTLKIGGRSVDADRMIELKGDVALPLQAEGAAAEILVLEGRPIGEPVAHYGPFVMNSRAELQQAFADYQRTQFGGWPWDADDPVHSREEGRFAKHPDGRVERPA